MRRILHIVDSLGHTGIATQMLSLARGMASHGDDVHVSVLNASPQISEATSAYDFPILNIGRRWPIDPLADVRLVRHIAALRPDIVHTWNTVPGMFGPLAAGFARSLSSGWGQATSRPSSLKSNEPPVGPRLIAGFNCIDDLQSAWDAYWIGQFSRRAERIVTNSSAIRDWCCKQKLPADKLTVISSGVPPAPRSDLSRNELLAELKLPPHARMIGVIGRLVPEKRVQDLIWAADLLRVLHDELRMLIIGDGALRSQLEQYARMASDFDHIRFLGERDDVWRIMPHLDVLWNGSDNRGVSIAMLEAMAAGVPVVASDVPVNREVVVHGETGFLVPIGVRSGRADRARFTDRLFTDGTLAGRLGAAASRRVAEQNSAEQFIERHTALYAEVNKAGRRAGTVTIGREPCHGKMAGL